MNSYGPVINEKYKSNPALLKFIDDCTEYISNHVDFAKYLVWRYTIGSASINSYLIFGKLSDNAPRWTYLFFQYYYNTYRGDSKRFPNPNAIAFNEDDIPVRYHKFQEQFDNPKAYLKLPIEKQKKIAEELIKQYIEDLQQLIKEAPKTPGEFHVFKVASKYPQLPSGGDQLPVDVLQLPFNSTTISPYFNFAPFLASPPSDCCLFDITVPKGSSCLFIPQEYHAYPFELEILLPHDCIFKVNKISTEVLNYVDAKTVNIVTVQDKDNIIEGPVYTLNEYAPCGNRGCIIQRKFMNVYNTTYKNP